MEDFLDAKLFLKNNVLPGMQLIIAGTLAKITLKKPLFTLLKNEYTRKTWIAASNQKVGISL